MKDDSFLEYYKITKEKVAARMEKFNEGLTENKNALIRENLSFFKNLNSGGKLIRGVLAHLGYYLLKDDADYFLYN